LKQNTQIREKELEEQLRMVQVQAQYKNEELEQKLARARAEKDEIARARYVSKFQSWHLATLSNTSLTDDHLL